MFILPAARGWLEHFLLCCEVQVVDENLTVKGLECETFFEHGKTSNILNHSLKGTAQIQYWCFIG